VLRAAFALCTLLAPSLAFAQQPVEPPEAPPVEPDAQPVAEPVTEPVTEPVPEPVPAPQPYVEPYTPPPPLPYAPPPEEEEPPPPRRRQRTPPPIEPPSCCLWSVRYDPFDLIQGQVTVEGEIALGSLPLSIEVAPSWIFDNFSDTLDESGFDIAARFGWYIQGTPLQGFFLKVHAEFQTFEATLFRGDLEAERYFGKPGAMCDADSAPGTCTLNIQSFLLGVMLGNSAVFGDDGGFALTGGIGVGIAVAQEKSVEVNACSEEDVLAGGPHCTAADDSPAASHIYYEGVGFGRGGRVNIIGSLGLGVTF
jgi:hypothetical protein